MPEAINYTLLREETDFCPRRISLIHEPCRKYYYFSPCWRVGTSPSRAFGHRGGEREGEEGGRSMSRMSIKHTGTHTPSRIPRKGTMCVLRHTRPTFGELDMICLMAGSPDPGSFSLILALPSPFYLRVHHGY